MQWPGVVRAAGHPALLGDRRPGVQGRCADIQDAGELSAFLYGVITVSNSPRVPEQLRRLHAEPRSGLDQGLRSWPAAGVSF